MHHLPFVFLSLGRSSFVSDPEEAYADTISACGTISSSGTYVLTQSLTPSADCFTVTADNVVIDGNGYNVTQQISNSGTLVSASGDVGHPNGYSVTVRNIRAAAFANAVVSSGYSYSNTNTGSTGGNGGNISIINSYLDGHVVSDGGSGDIGTTATSLENGHTGGMGGGGGTINISNATINGNIYSDGGAGGSGSSGGAPDGNPGSSGLNGGTGGAGGNGGTVSAINITITGTGIIYVNGGSGGSGGSGSSGQNGANGINDPNPGTSTNGGDGGNGGSGGGGGNGGNGGNGGSVSLTNYYISGSVVYSEGSGGSGSFGASGGPGGTGGSPSCDTQEPPNCGMQGADGVAGSAGSDGFAGSSGNTGQAPSLTNNSGGDLAPILQSASINRNVMTLTYDSVLQKEGSFGLLGSDFSITGNPNMCSASSNPQVSGSSVIVTLDCSVNIGESVNFTFTKGPMSNGITDMAAQNASNVTDSLTNNSSATTLYFYNASGNSWDTVANWFSDSGHTTPTGYLPQGGDTVYVDANVNTGPSSAVVLANLYVAQTANVNLATADNITVTNTATFGLTGSFSSSVTGDITIQNLASFYESSNIGANSTMTGNAEFHDSSYITYGTGLLDGDATFFEDSSGDNGLGSFEVTGTKTRKYTVDATVTRNFVTTGPWTVVADGAGVEVDVSGATYDDGTTFNEVNGAQFIYEHNAPSVSLTSPTGAPTISGSSYSLTANASDGSGVVGVKFYIDSNLVGSEDTSYPYSETLNTTSYPDGSYTIYAVARDITALYATSSSVGVTIDNTAPTVSITSPTASQTVTIFSPVVSWGDSSTCEYKYDSGSYSTVTCASNGSDIPAPSSGVHTLTVRGTDAGSNTSTNSVSFTYTPDTTGPSISDNGSSSGTLSAGTASATLSITTDENATCKYGTTPNTAYASIANTFSTTGGTSHSQSVSVSDGNSYSYYVRCIDGSSNANTNDYSISFSVTSPASSSSSSSAGGLSGHRNTSSGLSLPIQTGTYSPSNINTDSPAIQIIQSGSFSESFLIRTLQFRDSGTDVKDLQKFLNSQGFIVSKTGPGSPGKETTLFRIATYKALVKFQIANGLPGTGFLGPRTTKLIKDILEKKKK